MSSISMNKTVIAMWTFGCLWEIAWMALIIGLVIYVVRSCT